MEAISDIPEEARQSSEEELQSSNNSEDHLQSAQEQLAELQLLVRASSVALPSIEAASMEEEFDVVLNEEEPRGSPEVATGRPSAFTAIDVATLEEDFDAALSEEDQRGSPQVPTGRPSAFIVIEAATSEGEFDDHLTEVEPRGRPRVATGIPSAFTAVLAASRKIATNSADIALMDLESEKGIPVDPLPVVEDQEEPNEAILGRPRSPKVIGNSLPTLSEGAEGEEDDDGDEDDEIPETTSIITSTSFVSKLLSSRAEICPTEIAPAEIAPASVVQKDPDAPATCQELEESDTDDAEFVEMLEHLSRGKLDFLALTLDDLTIRKLKRVHAALRKAQAPSTMPFVRTLVSLDMLQLLSRRLGVQSVQDAIGRAMQHASESDEIDSVVSLVALLTSSNIAAVVLEARRDLATAEISMVSPQSSQRIDPAASIKRRSSQISSKSSSSPYSSISSSPRCGTPRSPAIDRRSILAKEGVHVLMQEKLTSYDHRGQANALPAFRVRGASASLTDSAAKRRQRGLQYANEHISHRTVHM